MSAYSGDEPLSHSPHHFPDWQAYAHQEGKPFAEPFDYQSQSFTGGLYVSLSSHAGQKFREEWLEGQNSVDSFGVVGELDGTSESGHAQVDDDSIPISDEDIDSLFANMDPEEYSTKSGPPHLMSTTGTQKSSSSEAHQDSTCTAKKNLSTIVVNDLARCPAIDPFTAIGDHLSINGPKDDGLISLTGSPVLNVPEQADELSGSTDFQNEQLWTSALSASVGRYSPRIDTQSHSLAYAGDLYNDYRSARKYSSSEKLERVPIPEQQRHSSPGTGMVSALDGGEPRNDHFRTLAPKIKFPRSINSPEEMAVNYLATLSFHLDTSHLRPPYNTLSLSPTGKDPQSPIKFLTRSASSPNATRLKARQADFAQTENPGATLGSASTPPKLSTVKASRSLDGTSRCPHCLRGVSAAQSHRDRQSNLIRHIRVEHSQDPRPQCPEEGCGRTFKRSDALAKHRRNLHRER